MTPIKDLISSFINESDINSRSAAEYRVIINMFYTYVSQRGADPLNITRADLIQFKRLKQTTCKDRTVNMYVIILKKYISWLNQNNHTDINLEGLKPIRISKSFSKQPLTEWEMKKLLGFHIRNIKDSRDKFMIKLLLATGLRLSEALSIRVSDVSYSNKKHYISITRKGKLQPISYAIPLSLYDAIRQWIEINKLKTNQYIIFSLPYKDQLNSNTATHIIKNRMRRAGINSVTKSAHSLRHTFATNLLKQGFSIYSVKSALGHASIKTTEIYTTEYDRFITNTADYLNRLDKLITGSNYKVFSLLVR